MFAITSKEDGSIHILNEEREYIVGRRDCDILIEGDLSVSRKHAIIRLEKGQVTLEDCNSKYKTHINDCTILPNVKMLLKPNDVIKFGGLNSEYVFEQAKYITTSSGLKSAEKESLKKNVTACGGIYIENWSPDCTHLTVEKITLTVKALQALIDEKPLVTPSYWKDLAESMKKKSEPPDINKYNKPPLAESLMKGYDFKPNPLRKTLFRNKVFLFPTESLKNQMEGIIKSCGGESISWEKNKLSIPEMKNSSKEYLIIQPDKKNDPALDTLIKMYKKLDRRTIPLQEIALSIVMCSCESNCNPMFNKVGQVFPTGTAALLTQNNALALETQTENVLSVQPKKELVIPPSVDDDVEPYFDSDKKDSAKRLLDDENNAQPAKRNKLEVMENSVKKAPDKQTHEASSSNKTIPTSTTSNIAQKRKAHESSDQEVPSKTVKCNPFAQIRTPLSKPTEISSDNPFLKHKQLKPQNEPKCLELPKKNPFASIRTKDSNISAIAQEGENPFMSIIKKETETTSNSDSSIHHSTLINRTNETGDVDIHYTRTPNTNMEETWRSKSSVKQENTSVREIDPEYAKIAELFKDCVRIEVLETYRRDVSHSTNSTLNITNGKKNFKKFKKVNPLRPQTTIISRNQFVIYGPGDTTGIEVSTTVSDEEDDAQMASSKATNKRKPKAFNF